MSRLVMLQTVQAGVLRLQEEYACARNGIGPLRLTKTQIFGLFVRKAWLDVVYLWGDATFGTRVALVLLLSFTAVFIADRVWAHHTSLTRRGFPLLRRPSRAAAWDFKAKLAEGARMFPNTPYIIRYSGFEQVVYPSSSFAEVKSLPVAQASLMEYFAHCFFEGWHFLGSEIGVLYDALGVDLRRSLPALVRERHAVARRAFGRVVGPCGEWKSVRLYGTVQRLVVMTNAPALVGPELGTDTRWLGGIDMFTYSLIFAVFTLSLVPRLLRPVAKYVAFAPNWLLYWRLRRLTLPVVEKGLAEYHERLKSPETSLGKSAPENFRLGTWLAARYSPDNCTPDRLAHDFIVTMFESMSTTICTLYFILSELVTRPDMADELRAELKANMPDGQLPMSTLGELRKMDSFMREATRANSFSYLAVFRRLQKPVTLSVGPKVPAGAIICVDAYNMVQSRVKWGDPDVFDSDRFLKMRQQPGHENLHQFASLDSDMPGWGGGLQACPGRFFADNSIKVFLSHLLLNYDIKLPSGSGKPSAGSMPNGSAMPDLLARIMIQERKEL